MVAVYHWPEATKPAETEENCQLDEQRLDNTRLWTENLKLKPGAKGSLAEKEGFIGLK